MELKLLVLFLHERLMKLNDRTKISYGLLVGWGAVHTQVFGLIQQTVIIQLTCRLMPAN